MEGVGRLDAEGCERAWADLNGASGSTSEKGPGARIDSLNHCMNDWNWRKTITMSTILIISKLREAVKMAQEQEESWLTLHEHQDAAMTSQWEQMSTAPRRIKGDVWTSVFLIDEKIGGVVSTRLRKVLDLNSKESARIIESGSTEAGYTAPSWISDGIDVENTQRRLTEEIQELGEVMTNHQSLDFYRRRVAITTCVTAHRQSAAMFLDLRLTPPDRPISIAKETDGQPEKAILHLPSQVFGQIDRTERSKRAIKIELDLRRMECMELLRRIRTASIQKSQLLMGKQKNTQGEIQNTRAQTALNRLSSRIKSATEDYNSLYKAMMTLGMTPEKAKPLRKLHVDDFIGLMTILRSERDIESKKEQRKKGLPPTVGEGHRRLPWFWTVREGDSSKEAEEQEFTEAIRVEWFRGRERFHRWQEEVVWLRREIASTLLDYRARSDEWLARAESNYSFVNSGYRAYCHRQADIWNELLEDMFHRSLVPLQVGNF
ncbi:hypothetical protein RSOL_293350 [Rhizoctonia solani AG-3 Rhs1AP]|nr:hypothetical protein RSOL_293350 [Rhizoctonia solani AG-3 Rhs1AP]